MSEIEEVKSRLNIVDVIGAKVELKKAGRNFRGLCPFHNEKTPSFMVSPERQTFHCFGCGKGGSVIDFLMEYDHVDFIEALETLAEKAGVTLTRRFDETPQAKLKARIFEVNHLTCEYYHYILTKHALGEKSRLYLKNRGVSDKTAETFMIGYSPASWDGLLRFLKKKGYDEKLLIDAGLIVSSGRGGYDRFRGRVMFPLRDHRSNILGFSGRVLDPTIKEAKYINTSETPVYVKSNVLFALDITKGAIQKANEAIIMEGEFDVISSWQEGISNVVAIKGSALTEGHVNLLKRFTERITFALDSDLAGDAASRRGIAIAEKAGMDLKVVQIKSGKDPDEAVRENPPEFKQAIQKAIPIYDYFITSAARRFDIKEAYGKKKVSEELLPILTTIENPVVQAHYMKKVAQTLDVSEDTIATGMKKIKIYSKDIQPKSELPKEKISRFEKLEVFILAMILQTKTKDFLEDFQENVDLGDISHPGIRQILVNLIQYISTHPIFAIQDFVKVLPNELLPVADEAFLWDIAEFIDDEDETFRRWQKTLIELRKSLLKGKMKKLASLLSHQESAMETPENQAEIEASITKLTEKLRTLEKMETI
jgi:DNA primase